MPTVKDSQYLPNLHENLSKSEAHEHAILTEFQVNWTKIVDFLLLAYFWTSVIFFVTVSSIQIHCTNDNVAPDTAEHEILT